MTPGLNIFFLNFQAPLSAWGFSIPLNHFKGRENQVKEIENEFYELPLNHFKGRENPGKP
jgi:hypothetical protein